MRLIHNIVSGVCLSLSLLFVVQGATAQKKTPQTITVEGVLVDENNQPVEGATVKLQEKSVSTETGPGGLFYLLALPNDVLVVERSGYRPIVERLSNKKSYRLQLSKYAQKEDEKITVGYGEKSRRQLTSAVSVVGPETVRQNAVSSIEESMNGTLSGLYSIKSGGEKYGRSNYSLLIRGKATNATSSPLILVDDIEGNIDLMSPSEIESITVLKDASELAIYGMRGANGAILVKTKRGSQTRNYIDLTVRLGFQAPEYVADRLNAYQYATLYNEALRNDGDAPRFNPDAYLAPHDPYQYPDENYRNQFIKPSGFYENYIFQAGGGNQIARYYVTAGYLHQNGLFKQTNSNPDHERYNFRTNLDVNITKELSVNVLMSGAISRVTSPFINKDTAAVASINNVFNTLMTLPANAFPMFNQDGTLGGTSEYQTNPYGLLNRRGRRTEDSRLFNARIQARYDFGRWVKGLSAEAFYGFENFNQQYVAVNQAYAVYARQPDGSYTQYGKDDNKDTRNSGLMSSHYRYGTFTGAINYARRFENKHDLGLRLLYNQSEQTIPGDNPDSKYQQLSLQAKYALLDRYYADLTATYQGSTNYMRGKRNGLFPALGLGWIVSDEEFMQSASAVEFLKLRASVGLVGNDQTGGKRFPYRQEFTTSGGYQFGNPNGSSDGTTEGALANPNETWEKSMKTNIGFDIELLKGLSLTADYFYERRSDILVSYSDITPGLIGIALPKYNGGLIENQGVDATINYVKQYRNGGFNVGGNVLYARNKVIDLKETTYQYAHQYRKGYSVDARFGYQTNGLYLSQEQLANAPVGSFGIPQLGDIAYVNQNPADDNIIDERDKVYIGASLPQLIYGINLGGNYRGFDLQCQAEGSALYDAYYKPTSLSLYTYNNRWLPSQPSVSGYMPRMSLASSYNNETSSYWQHTGAMFRLASVELGYTMPTKLTQKIKLSKVRFYVNGNNLLTLSPMIDGRNPEATDAGYSQYPLMRSVVFGLNICL